MVEFLFKTLIGKGLPVAVTWAAVSLSALGAITVTDAYFGTTGLIKCQSFEVDLRWRTVLSDVIEVDNVKVRGLSVKTFIEDPLHVIRCLKGENYASKFTAKKIALTNNNRSSCDIVDKEHFKALIHTVEVADGELIFVANNYRLRAKILSAKIHSVHLPLSDKPVLAKLALEVKDVAGKSHQLKAEIKRPRGKDMMIADVYTKAFPVELIAPLFDKASTSGRLSGKLRFSYEDGRWKLPSQLRAFKF